MMMNGKKLLLVILAAMQQEEDFGRHASMLEKQFYEAVAVGDCGIVTTYGQRMDNGPDIDEAQESQVHN